MGSNIIITITIGLILNKLIDSVIFLLIIIPLRSIAGGFHAESSAVCFVVSIAIYIISIFLSSTLKIENSAAAIIFLILLIAVGFLTPVDSCHKVLDKKQKLKQRISYIKLSALIIFCLSVIFHISFITLQIL